MPMENRKSPGVREWPGGHGSNYRAARSGGSQAWTGGPAGRQRLPSLRTLAEGGPDGSLPEDHADLPARSDWCQRAGNHTLSSENPEETAGNASGGCPGAGWPRRTPDSSGPFGDGHKSCRPSGRLSRQRHSRQRSGPRSPPRCSRALEKTSCPALQTARGALTAPHGREWGA